ncbi:MAG: RNA polymerase sigma factor [Bacteroidota bacterium]
MKKAESVDAQLAAQLQGTAQERTRALKTLYMDAQLKQYIIAFITKNGGNKQDAEDVFQDAIILVDRRVRQGGYEGSGTLGGYIQGIAKRLWLRKRQQWNERTTALTVEAQEEVEENIEVQLIGEERIKVIQLILEDIGERCKKILTMYKLKHSMEEIAAAMHLATAKVAKNEAYRCRQKFRAFVEQHANYAEVLGVTIRKQS